MRRASLAGWSALALLTLAAGVANAGDQWEGVVAKGEPRVAARLVVHPDDVGSSRVRVGVLFDLDPGWHIYWHRSGDTGMPTRLHWRAEGGRIGPLTWPAPRHFEDDGFETFGYEDRVLLATVVERSGPEPLGIARVDVELLACRSVCIPARFGLALSLEDGSPAAPGREAFASLMLATPAEIHASDASATDGGPALGIVRALLLALLGGVLLNAMPCVLPVLAMKLVSLSELARLSRREMLRHTTAYSAGALACMAIFALAVAGLRAAGAAVGWGFQFQEPRFVAALCALLVVFAANLFGAFEIRVGVGRLADLGIRATGARRSFFDGLLVVLLATPCSAPFLGTAVGFAFASPVPVIFAIFAAVGLGLTAPHWMVAAFPPCTRWVPRAGPWTVHLRTALGLGLLATVVWLLSVLSRSVASGPLLGLAGLLAAIAATAKLAGRLQGKGRSGAGFAGAALALSLTGIYLVGAGAPQPARFESGSGDGRFDARAVRAELERGRPVFVYFTADWCITCKVNERAVLSRRRFREAVDRLDVAVFRGDWTMRDEEIRAELARHGKAGVPAYLIYRPDAPDRPRVLPELLTLNLVVDALRAAAQDPIRANAV